MRRRCPVSEAHEEWGEWECPVCGSEQEDPGEITMTSCANGHTCLLGPVEDDGTRCAWEEVT
jgi:hypothetical protein